MAWISQNHASRRKIEFDRLMSVIKPAEEEMPAWFQQATCRLNALKEEVNKYSVVN